MECDTARNWLSRKIDGELSDQESVQLNIHLEECASCLKEYEILSLPQRISQTTPLPVPSPYFYQKLKLRIEDETQNLAHWQAVFSMARRLVPALACITLALLSVFAYLQMSSPETEIYSAYERIFVPNDQPNRMLLFKQGDITDAIVLSAIADRESRAGIR
jgi:predicted anti-sigma-YlaC factor YlaD